MPPPSPHGFAGPTYGVYNSVRFRQIVRAASTGGQHPAVGQQRGREIHASVRHWSGRVPRVGEWVVQRGGEELGEEILLVTTAENEHLPGLQRNNSLDICRKAGIPTHFCGPGAHRADDEIHCCAITSPEPATRVMRPSSGQVSSRNSVSLPPNPISNSPSPRTSNRIAP